MLAAAINALWQLAGNDKCCNAMIAGAGSKAAAWCGGAGVSNDWQMLAGWAWLAGVLAWAAMASVAGDVIMAAAAARR